MLMDEFVAPFNAAALDWSDDNAERNNRFIKAFIDRKLEECAANRAQHWNSGFQTDEFREKLRFITGVVDSRVPYDAPLILATMEESALLAQTKTHNIYLISWPVFADFSGEGLLLEPKNIQKPCTVSIYIPHAGVSPEMLLGLSDEAQSTANNTFMDVCFSLPDKSERMIILTTVDRCAHKLPDSNSLITNREFIWRGAMVMGRGIIGYEIQEVMSLVDWIKKDEAVKLRLEGQGDGGLLALYTAALDKRIDEAIVTDYFNPRDRMCEEPIDREVHGLLKYFSDAEIANLIAPRKLTVIDYKAPVLSLNSETGGAPGQLSTLDSAASQLEVKRAEELAASNGIKGKWISYKRITKRPRNSTAMPARRLPDTQARMIRLVDGMDKHTQRLLFEAEYRRRKFWSKLDTSSPAAIAHTIEWYRQDFALSVIGEFTEPAADLNPHARLIDRNESYTVYEVELDVYFDLKVNGTLLIPADIKPGERRQAVICQHGLERSSKAHIRGWEVEEGDAVFFSEVCEAGYIVFAPQGIFALGDKFRFLQRQCHSLGKSMFSVMLAQYKQIVQWLNGLSFVAQGGIGMYGVSYGGATAMYLTPLIPAISWAICSANFNNWVNKLVNSHEKYKESYVHRNEYEIFEFNLGNTYNHGDMAKLIAPRPFLVERGHQDSVAQSETVGYEFAKVRFFYDHCLKMSEKTEILWFDGGHTTYVRESLPYIAKFFEYANVSAGAYSGNVPHDSCYTDSSR